MLECYNRSMIVSASPAENRFLTAASWDEYNRYLEAVGDRRIRITYDGTMVELMTPSHRHEYLKTMVQHLLVCFMEESEIDFIPGGNTTFKQALLNKGLEPDDCYWIGSWREVLGGWNASTGPPPDLAIEVEVTRSALDRLSIYAALGVPELCLVREDGQVSAWQLGDGKYQARSHSLSLPGLPLALLNDSLSRAGELSAMRLLKAFRQAVRQLPEVRD